VRYEFYVLFCLRNGQLTVHIKKYVNAKS